MTFELNTSFFVRIQLLARNWAVVWYKEEEAIEQLENNLKLCGISAWNVRNRRQNIRMQISKAFWFEIHTCRIADLVWQNLYFLPNKILLSIVLCFVTSLACEKSRPSSLPARVAFHPGAKKDGCFRKLRNHKKFLSNSRFIIKITAILCFRKYVIAVVFALFWDIRCIRFNLWIFRT